MAADAPARRSRRLAIALVAVALVIVAAAGAWLTFGGEDDGLGDVRDQGAVASATDDGRGLEVVLERGATAREVEAVLRALPKTTSGSTRPGEIVLGEAKLLVEGSAEQTMRVVPTFLAASTIARTGIAITVPSGASASSISVKVQDRGAAVPAARALVDRLAPDGRWPEGVEGLFVDVIGGTREPMPVTLGRFAARADATIEALEVAAAAPAAAKPTVAAGYAKVELRLLADRTEVAGDLWRRTATALGSQAKEVELSVDVMQRALALRSNSSGRDEGLSRRPVLFGTASDDPARGLALLGKLVRVGELPAVATDRSFAQLTVDRYGLAREANALAGDASIDRFTLTWTARPNGTDVADLPTVLTDRPSVLARLLPGVANATERFGISWAQTKGVARLSVTLRGEEAERFSGEDDRRALMTRIKAIDWPGSAEVRVPIGPGSCTGSSSLATAVITTTRAGRATSTEVGSACTDRDDLEAVEQDWNAAPLRAAGS